MGDFINFSALNSNLSVNFSDIRKSNFDVNTVLTVQATFGLLDTLIGSLANAFLLLVILTSGKLRNDMRNVLIANLAIADFLVDVLCQPFAVDISFRPNWAHGCYFFLFLQFLNAVAFSFMSLWGIIGIDALLLVRIARSSPLTAVVTSVVTSTVWTRRLQLALKVLVVALPWLLSIVAVVPIFVVGLRVPLKDMKPDEICFIHLSEWAERFVNVLFFILPISILVVIFVTIAIICLIRRRRRMGLLSFAPPTLSMPSDLDTSTSSPTTARARRSQHMESDQEPLSPYIVASFVTIVMMGAKHAFIMGQNSIDVSIDVFVILVMTILVLGDMKSTVLPFVWLFMFSDIKEQAKHLIKSCRNKVMRVEPEPPIEVSVAYTNLSDD